MIWRLLAVLLLWAVPVQAFPHHGGPGIPYVPATIDPGPSLALYNAPYYTCVTNYYVSTTGNDSNNGTSSGTPWLTLAHAASQSVAAGSCINIVPGLYSQSSLLTIANGGNAATATGLVAWRCQVMPFSFSAGALQGEGTGCHVQASGAITGDLVDVTASYVIVDGLELDGNSFDVTGACYNMNSGGLVAIHHMWIVNSDTHGCGAGGIFDSSSYTYVIHDVNHDNSGANFEGNGISVYEPLGISGYSPTTLDNLWCATIPSNICFQIVVAYTVSYHNYDIQSGSSNTDGEGLIFDTFDHTQTSCPGPGVCPFAGNALALGNLLYYNGGSGLRVYNNTAGATVYNVNNTAYDNQWDTHYTSVQKADYWMQVADNVYWLNNIVYSVVSGSATFYLDGGTSNIANNNISYPGSKTVVVAPPTYSLTGPGANLDGTDPLLTSLTPNQAAQNFALTGSSPAISFATPFSLWPTTDDGACQHQLTTCP